MKLSGSILVCSVLLGCALPCAGGFARPIPTGTSETSAEPNVVSPLLRVKSASVVKPATARYRTPAAFTPKSREWGSHRKVSQPGAVKIQRVPAKKSSTVVPVATATSAADVR